MAAAACRGPLRVLLVEDDENDVLLLKRAFRRSGFETDLTVASDGDAAMALLNAAGRGRPKPLPELILLDLNMPGMDGHSVLRELKEDPELRRIPVVILSTSQEPRDILQSYDLHANTYIPKPSDGSGYQQIMQVIDRYWRDIAARPTAENG